VKSMQMLFLKVQNENPSAEDLHVFFTDWSDEDLILMLEQLEFLETESTSNRIVNIIQYEVEWRILNASLPS
jgi:hypothetical protein